MRAHTRITVLITATLLVAGMAAVPPARGANPFGTTGCGGVRPGGLIEAPANNLYTMGFMYKDHLGARYIATAGHFVLPSAGGKKWKVGTGPKAKAANGKVFGRFVYAKYIDTPDFDSFALVRLTAGYRHSPQMCHFGGPTGTYTATGTSPVQLQYYGQGFPLDGGVHARTGVALGTVDKTFVMGAGLPGIGDDGGPVTIGGKALGIVAGDIAAGFTTTVPPNAGNLLVTRLPKWIAAAQKSLKVKLYLLTAKRL